MRLGTRGSALALAQARLVADALGGAEVVPIRASGDEPAGADDKSRFVREIELALLAGEVDLGVHSAKDLPAELPEALRLVGVPAREQVSDAYVGAAGSLAELTEGARIGTASLRRRAQLLAARPDLELEDLRGNVDTRLRRLAERDLDGIVLAVAGLRRLGREEEVSFRFPIELMTPAAGQGALALEARRDDERAAAAAAGISDAPTLVEVTAERSVVGALGATCRTPVGVRAELTGERLRIDAFVGLVDGSEWVRDAVDGSAGDPAALGRALAERVVAAGGADLLARGEALR